MISQQSALASNVPHSPSLEKDSNSLYRAAYLNKMRDWRDATKTQALSAYRSSPEYNNVATYIKFLENDSWDRRRPAHRSSYRNNKMGLTRKDRLARMSDANPTISIDSSVDAYEQVSEVLENTLRCEWSRLNMSQTLLTAYDLSLLHGTSFIKTGAKKDSVLLTPLGPDQVIPIQPGLDTIQTSAAIYHGAMKPISYIRRVFPFSSAGVERFIKAPEIDVIGRSNRPEKYDKTTWDGMSGGLKRVLGVRDIAQYDSGVGDKYYGAAELEEYYMEDYSRNESNHEVLIKDPFMSLDAHNWHYKVQPGERLYPRKRLIIFVGDILLYDGPSPYWHGMYPFSVIWCNKVTWSFYGLSLYRELLPMQKMVNEIPAGISDTCARALNPPLITKQNVVGPEQFRSFASDLPGARLILNGNVPDIEKAFIWQKPPEIPTYVPTFLQGVLNPEFDRLAGNVDLSALTDKNQMAGGDTIDSMRDALQTQLKLEEKYVEGGMTETGKQLVSNIIQFYSTKKRMQLLGEDGVTMQDFMYDPKTIYPGTKEYGEQYWKLFAMRVKPGSLNSGAKSASKLEAVGLVSRGLISRQEFFRRMGVPQDKARQILEELMQEGQTVQAMMNGGGGGSGAPSGPNGGGAGGTRTPRDSSQREGTEV